ncbi:PrsW family intramembrane metalloprotease [Naumannella sp. ID2617S]|nr:PrsW family intramembrane metalloprotease [Naumannella sp. ID2617S]
MTQPSMSYPPPQQSPMPYRPASRLGWPVLRKKQMLVLPIITIILGSLVMGALVLLTTIGTSNKGIALLAILCSALVSSIGVLLLLWLDRWEPEPPHLLVAAFFWGGGVCLILVVIFNLLLSAVGGSGDFFGATIAAPLAEESAKALFLVLILLTSRRGRGEFNSLTDALVYAGFIGIGFSFIEDLMYIAGQKTVGEALLLAGIRLGLGAFSHSIYTAMTAIGIWKGMNSRGAMRFIWPFLGWCAAVLLHGLHNGSTFLGIGAFFGMLVLVALPAFICIVVMAVFAFRREGRVVQQQLPVMVHSGWISPTEAGWLGHLKGRKQQLAAAQSRGKEERTRLQAFRDNATELAFVRDRLDDQQRRNQQLSPELLTQHDELVGLLSNNKQWVDQQLAPHASGWSPMPGAPGTAYPMG